MGLKTAHIHGIAISGLTWKLVCACAQNFKHRQGGLEVLIVEGIFVYYSMYILYTLTFAMHTATELEAVPDALCVHITTFI